MYALHDRTSVALTRDSKSATPMTACNNADCSLEECKTGLCPLLKSFGKVRSFEKGDVIFWDGDDADVVYLLESGVVRASKVLGDGRRQVARFGFPGEMLEYSCSATFPYTAEAITPVTVVALPRQHLDRQMSQTPCLRRLVMQVIMDELDATRGQLLALGRLSAMERVAFFLRDVAQHVGTERDGAFTLPMSRQDIADYLGLTIETVSRIISKMKRCGQIRLVQTDRIIIRDMHEFEDDLLADVA